MDSSERRERRRVTGLVTAIVAAILVLWQFGPIDVSLWSRPSIAISRAAELWVGVPGLPPLWQQIASTLGATLGGLVVGVFAGFVCAVALAEFSYVRRVLTPFLAAINAVPRVAWVPVITLVFGFGIITKLVMSGAIVFLVVFFNVLDAAVHAPPVLIDGVRALGGDRLALMRDVRAYSAIGAVVAALPNAIAFALVGVVFAESLSAESGLGALMFNAMHRGSAEDLIVSAVTLGLIGLALTALATRAQTAVLRQLGSDGQVASSRAR